MGDCLRKALGDAYRSFGFTFYEGTYTGIRPDSREFIQQAQRAFPGTLEYLLGQLGEKRFLLDLKRFAPKTRTSPLRSTACASGMSAP